VRESFRDRDPVKVGVVSMALLLVVTGLALNAGPIYQALTSRTYTALFTDAGGVKPKDPVKVNGVKMGMIDSVEVEGDHVAITFKVRRDGRMGIDTRAVIKASTLLGFKVLALEPHGPGELEDGAVIPVERTDPGYDITTALAQLSRTSEQLDKPGLRRALDTVSTTLADTPKPLRGALQGLDRLTATLAARDDELRELLLHARPVTGVLAQRSQDLVTLVGQGERLVAALNARRQVIRELISRVNTTIDEVNGLVDDNRKQLGPALDGLKQVVDLLERNDRNIAATVQGLNTYAGSLGEAVGGGPWFFASLANLPPTNFAPPLPLGANPLVRAPAPQGAALVPPPALPLRGGR
jgi:phospholipid/cholesterol/gamma-HCH transport system substrate-binding protein